MSDENIVLFPFKETHKIPPPKSIDEVKMNQSMIRLAQIDEAINDIFSNLLEVISLTGFRPSEDSYKQHAFLFETLRATLNSYYGLHHPINEVIENIVTLDDEGLKIDFSKIKKKRKSKLNKE